MAEKSIVQDYWRGVAERLQVEANRMNTHGVHRGEIGRANEASLVALISSSIPTGYGVGTGVIFNADGERSNQTDIVIYSQVDQPRILAQTTQTLFPVETVTVAVEVKTTFTKEEVADVERNLRTCAACWPRRILTGASTTLCLLIRAVTRILYRWLKRSIPYQLPNARTRYAFFILQPLGTAARVSTLD
ncbi:DUF6602 domain-containing protein [Janibacter melonis]|uniref:DUF6602 domain-containing protein n=1 Tax=Janibacter melonis TaxID=262209 RepID=UPI0039A65E12